MWECLGNCFHIQSGECVQIRDLRDFHMFTRWDGRYTALIAVTSTHPRTTPRALVPFFHDCISLTTVVFISDSVEPWMKYRPRSSTQAIAILDTCDCFHPSDAHSYRSLTQELHDTEKVCKIQLLYNTRAISVSRCTVLEEITQLITKRKTFLGLHLVPREIHSKWRIIILSMDR